MAATVPVEREGAANPLLEQAQQIGVLEPSTQDSPADNPVEPSVGSYEAFMASFGSPGRWAGR